VRSLPFFVYEPKKNMSYFFGGIDAIMGSRTARQRERASHTLLRALEARQDAILPAGAGGSADMPARAQRSPRSAVRKASGDDSSEGGDGPARPYTLSATAHEGITVRTSDGRPAALAVIDADGNVVAGDVASEAWAVAVHAYRQFLQGTGHLRVHASAPSYAKT
jgi:hypothetical protein